jgi:hypothetical protein
MSDKHFLPATPTVRITPELLARLVENRASTAPFYEEGDVSLTVNTEELAEVMRKMGYTVVVGYQQWGSNAGKGGADGQDADA